MKKILYFLLITFTVSCSNLNSDKERIRLLEVEGKFLYKDEVDKIIPPNTNAIDSTSIADRYVRKWVTDVLVYENASRNITDLEEINKLVEEYRKSLTIHQYEQALVSERLSNTIPEAELEEFYKQYSAQLALPESLIQGLLLVIPKNAQQKEEVKNWVKDINSTSLSNLEKYSLKNAISYDLFINKWMPFSEIIKKAPFKFEDSNKFVTQTTFAETSDSTKTYLLHITKALPMGEIEPYELAKEKISAILLNKKKSEFILKFENDLYNDAVKNGSINYLDTE